MKENLKKWIGLLILWIDFEIKLVVVLVIVLDFDRDWINYEWTLIRIERDWNKLMKIKKIGDWLWLKLVENKENRIGLW